MPISHAIWTVGANPAPLGLTRLPSEQLLEDMIVRQPGILSDQWMLIGRQEATGLGGRIDLLAVAPDGTLVLIELKRDRTPREIVAQALDYASWLEQLTTDKLAQIYQRHSSGGSLGDAFKTRFGIELDEEALNSSHQIVLVASELDASTERIIGYLNARGIAINVVFFQVFQHGDSQLLSRAWLIDPGETQSNVVASVPTKAGKEPWNGEYYVSYGDRSWPDAVKYGFVSGGGGSWYSQTLRMLSPGDRIWVKIPGTGYVGVGRVVESSQSAQDFKVDTPKGPKPALDVLNDGDRYRAAAAVDADKTEHFVRVQWLDTVPESKAFDEVGLFGNQNTVCRPRTQQWRHTVDRLKTRFPRWGVG